MITTRQAARSIPTDAFSLGHSDARTWLKNPNSKPLAYLRLEYHDMVTDSREWGTLNTPSAYPNVTGSMEMFAMYGASIDSVIEEFIVLTNSMARGVLQ